MQRIEKYRQNHIRSRWVTPRLVNALSRTRSPLWSEASAPPAGSFRRTRIPSGRHAQHRNSRRTRIQPQRQEVVEHANDRSKLVVEPRRGSTPRSRRSFRDPRRPERMQQTRRTRDVPRQNHERSLPEAPKGRSSDGDNRGRAAPLESREQREHNGEHRAETSRNGCERR